MNADLRNEIVRRWREGASQRTIARLLGLSRGAVWRVLAKHQAERGGEHPPTARRPSLLTGWDAWLAGSRCR